MFAEYQQTLENPINPTTKNVQLKFILLYSGLLCELDKIITNYEYLHYKNTLNGFYLRFQFHMNGALVEDANEISLKYIIVCLLSVQIEI